MVGLIGKGASHNAKKEEDLSNTLWGQRFVSVFLCPSINSFVVVVVVLCCCSLFVCVCMCVFVCV